MRELRHICKYAKIYNGCMRVIKTIQSKIDSIPIMYGEAMVVRAKLNLKPIKELMGDDVHYALSIREKGYRAVFARDANFIEEVLPRKEDYLNQKVRRAEGVIKSFIYHKKMLFNPRYGLFGFFCFPLDWFLFLFQPILSFLLIILAFLFILVQFSILYFLLSLLVFLLLVTLLPSLRGFLIFNSTLVRIILNLSLGRNLKNK